MNDRQAKKYFLQQARGAGMLPEKTQIGGYPAGFKLNRDPQGRREFTVEVDKTLRDLLNLPEEQTTYGSYFNKKVVEAARRAYTEICEDAQNLDRDSPKIKITLSDTYNQSAKPRGGQASPPKASAYYVKRIRSPTPVKYKTKDRPVIYQWKTQIVPIKRHQDLEGSKELKQQRNAKAKAKYQRLAKKPSRYPIRGKAPIKSSKEAKPTGKGKSESEQREPQEPQEPQEPREPREQRRERSGSSE